MRRPAASLEQVKAVWALPVLGAASLVALVGILYLNSYKTFYFDEWDFVTAYRPSQSTSILLPHNEHWSTIPILLWKVLFAIFGLRNHLPYQAAAVAAHIVCVIVLFLLIRRRSGELPAFAAALILLLLGSGATDIVFAFQVTWTLSIAFGLAALLLIDQAESRPSRIQIAAISLLLLASLMSSGLGLSFLVAAGVQILLDSGRRLLLVALVIPALGYGAWFVTYGAAGSPCGGCPSAVADLHSIGIGYLVQVGRYMSVQVAASFVGVAGLALYQTRSVLTQALLVACGAVLALHWAIQGSLKSWEVGLVAGFVTQLTLVALSRAYFGVEGAADPHYVYVGVVYLLPLIANAIKHVPWRLAVRPVWIGFLAIALIGNTLMLVEQSLAQVNLIKTQNAELLTLELFRGAPDLGSGQPLDKNVVPQLTAAKYYPAIDELGSPLPSSLPRSLDGVSPRAVDTALVEVFGTALTRRQSSQGPAGLCQAIPTPSGLTVETRVTSGRSIWLQSTQDTAASLSLGYLAPPISTPLLQTQLVAGIPAEIHIPDTGRSIAWRLRVTAPTAGTLKMCGPDFIQAHSGAAIYGAQAAGGIFDPGWRSASDPAAYGGLSARIPAGSVTNTWKDDFFGDRTPVGRGTYDVWYRVRVASATGTKGEMKLGLFDTTAWRWLGSTTYAPRDATTSYAWVRTATSAIQTNSDDVVFVAEFTSRQPLSTDWFIDEAMLLPAGSQAPTDLGVNAVSNPGANS